MATLVRKWASEPNIDSESDTQSRSIFSEDDPNSSATELEVDDSEVEDLRQSIVFHRSQGRARSRRSSWSNRLISREFEHWIELVKYIYVFSMFSEYPLTRTTKLLRKD